MVKNLANTYKHQSSMLQDLRAGKITEIEAINGVIVAEGIRRNIKAPFNFLIYNLISFLQDK